MKDKTNTELVQGAYQKIQDGDMPAFLESLAEDIVWQMPELPKVPFSGTWKGRQQVAEFFKRVGDSQDIVEFVPEEFIAQGDKVIVLGRFVMNVKATRKTSRSGWAHVWTVVEGKVRAMREYVDTFAVNQAHIPA